MVPRVPRNAYNYIMISMYTKEMFPNASIGFNKAMSAGWVAIEKTADGEAKVFRKVCDEHTKALHDCTQ